MKKKITWKYDQEQLKSNITMDQKKNSSFFWLNYLNQKAI